MKIEFKKSFFAGLLGGCLIIGVFIITLLCLNIFNYNVSILRAQTKDECLKTDSTNKEIIADLLKNDIIQTPERYTGNLVNYYNTALLILSAMIVVFSFLSYFHLKFLSEEHLRKRLKSEEFEQTVLNTIFGKAEEGFSTREEFDKLKQNLNDLQSKIDLINNSFVDGNSNEGKIIKTDNDK